MADSRHLEKSPYFCNGLTNLHEIWNADAYRHSEPPQHWKFRTSKNRTAPS